MNSAAQNYPRTLFRSRAAALANTAVLGWTALCWVASFWLMSSDRFAIDGIGVLLCAHAMVLATYLIHEAAHQNLFAIPAGNSITGEAMSFIAGSSYASFERLRHLHIRHHVDRADVTCFDFKGLLQRNRPLRRLLQSLEWGYIPATEILMHLQVVWRPFFVAGQRHNLPRSAAMLALRVTLLVLLGLWSLRALVLYFLAYGLLLHVLNFFDAFHHTFEQHFVSAEDPIEMGNRDRHYEQANTYSNLISTRHEWLNLLTLNFGYHNAHHHRPSMAWYRLPSLHRDLYGTEAAAVLPLSELIRSWHSNRVRRVTSDDYGVPGTGTGRADGFVGAHGVSFLTVV